MNPSHDRPNDDLAAAVVAPPRRQEAMGLGLLFGTMYFVQGIAEPTEGLIAQPVRSLLRSWEYSVDQIAYFAALLALPWSIKPLYGLVTDLVPLAGYRRKSYLLLCGALAGVALLALYFSPVEKGAHTALLLALLVPTVCVAFSDVVIDALMVEKGQPLGLTGRLQSVQWTSIWAATLLTGSLGGYLSQHSRQTEAFLICGCVSLAGMLLALAAVREPPVAAGVAARVGGRGLWRAMRSGSVWATCAFIFLWNFNPFSSTVLYLHVTETLGLSEQFYGNMLSINALGAMLGSLAYGLYCRRVRLPKLVHVSIVAGIAYTGLYAAMGGGVSAIAITWAAGIAYMTGTLVQLDLAARACPPAAAGTIFALIMAISNFSTLASTAVGGYLYQQSIAAWGSQDAFNLMVVLGASFTATCWLVVPFLPREPAS